jgi:hypothetical protein
MHAGLSPANANVEDRGMEPRRREHRRPVLLRQLCIGRNYNGGREPSRRRRGIAQPSLPGRAQLDGANPGTRRSIEGEPLRCCRAWLAAQAKISPAPSPPADESRRFVMLRLRQAARALAAARACRVCPARCGSAVRAGSGRSLQYREARGSKRPSLHLTIQGA